MSAAGALHDRPGPPTRVDPRRWPARALLLTAFVLTAAAVAPGRGTAQGPGPAPGSAPPWRSWTPAGPLTAEEGAPLQRLGLTLAVESAEPVPAGRLRTDLWLGYTNIFEQDSSATHDMYLDMERVLAAFTARYGLSERWEVGARATLESTFGGILDPVVLRLHHALGLGSRSRPLYPEGAYGQRLERDGVPLVDIERRDLAVDDVRLHGKWLAYASRDGARALSLKAVARIPVTRNRVGRERADLGLVVLGRTRWRRWYLHGMLGGTTVRRSDELAPVLNRGQYVAMAGAEYPFSRALSGVVEFTLSSPLLRAFHDRDVDGHLTNTILGLVWRTGGGWRWEAALQEDTPPWGPSLDFTLQLGVSRVW